MHLSLPRAKMYYKQRINSSHSRGSQVTNVPDDASDMFNRTKCDGADVLSQHLTLRQEDSKLEASLRLLVWGAEWELFLYEMVLSRHSY